MADMPTDFWGGWIAVITVVSLVALGWLVFSVYFSDDAHEESQAPIWDETLKEGSNPAPMWWFWLILLLMVFSVIYLMLYPGLGSYSGALKWSQGGRLQKSGVAYANEFGDLRQRLTRAPLEELRADPAAMATARRIFVQNCAACHGQSAGGQAALFPDLSDEEWQWGGSTDQLEQSIRLGRNAVMPAWGPALGEDGITKVLGYLAALASSHENAVGHPGELQYRQFCVACHGANATGNVALGAPNLVDDIWLYGGGNNALAASIENGRNGVMPPFGERLDDLQIRLLVAWLSSRDLDNRNAGNHQIR